MRKIDTKQAKKYTIINLVMVERERNRVQWLEGVALKHVFHKEGSSVALDLHLWVYSWLAHRDSHV